MDKIIKAVLFGGKARVALIDTTETVNKAIKVHDLTPLAAAALGRSLTVGAYIESNLKHETNKFNLIINGGGPIGKIYVTSDRVGTVKGLVENPQVDLPLRKDGKLDVGGAVGKNGDIVIIKDLGLKEPYVGRSALISGEIAEDYNNYLFKSEGILNAVALGVLNDKDGCKAAGGIIIEAMPDADDNMVVILEDIMTNFTNISALIAEKGINEIAEYYFGHLDAEFFPEQTIQFRCDCWHKVRRIIKSLGRKEVEEIMKEQGMLEVKCDYCRKNYVYTEKDLDYLFEEDNK